MMRLSVFVIVSFVFTVNVAFAVSINEVAWMGGLTSANHEWIELYNEGDGSVSVDGWVLSDGMNLSITLSGTMAAKEYVVLERSSEESAPSSAFLIYTGALVNTGATLVLRDSSGNIIDQVSGGEGWSLIGGDNVTKETAQYTSSGWVTDVATPGLANRSGRVEEEEEGDEGEEVEDDTGVVINENTKSTNKTNSVPPAPKKIVIDAPSVVFVYQAVFLKVITDKSYQTVRFDWNFGDSYNATGTAVTHRFNYPGTYIVSVSGRIKGEEVLVEKEINVLPTAFSIGTASDGSLQLHNDSHYDSDISGYTLYAGRVVKFPPHTKIKAKGTITIPRSKLGSREVRLVTDAGMVLSLNNKASVESNEKTISSVGGSVVVNKNDKVGTTKVLPILEEILVPAKSVDDSLPLSKNKLEILFLAALIAVVGLLIIKRPQVTTNGLAESS